MRLTVELEPLLKERDISLYEFCKVSNISYQQGSDILKKRTTGISFDTIEKICLYLNCEIGDLFTLEGSTQGYLSYLLKNFPETENVKRLPQTKVTDLPKPFLQWVGGKREMIKQYKDFIPKTFNKYWEPFLGGGALYFHLGPKPAVINDNNPELVKTYAAVRDNPEEIIDLLLQFKRKHSKELYIAVRSIDRKLDILKDLKNYEVAARMIYLNQTRFNGVYRLNKSGQYNVPIGSSLNRVICDPEAIRKASAALKTASLQCEDFEKHLGGAKKNDFVYLDPPYVPISEYSDFTRYTKEKFYKRDQIRLSEIVKELDARGCYVMLSNSSANLVKELYSQFNIHVVRSGRNLNSKKERRGKIAELLITNYKV